MQTSDIYTILTTILISVIASSGFWSYISTRRDKVSFERELLIGLAHERIVSLGFIYTHRGWITQAEYEDFTLYLYKPYERLGGNGMAKRIMLEIDKLPIRKDKMLDRITGDTLP